jgi:hypothetical protein
MVNDIVPITEAQILEKVVIDGDLSKLTPKERLMYYNKTCESLGLNPLTRPFEYVRLQGKLTFYARKDATEQLRRVYQVSIDKLEAQVIEGVFIVTAYASTKDRTDVASGAVSILGLKGNDYANAIMKAETKAKRRVTLSICGLGITDESEIETIPHAKIVAEQDIRRPLLVEECLHDISLARNLEQLKVIFLNACDEFKGNQNAISLFIQKKDEKKFELEKGQSNETTLRVIESIPPTDLPPTVA